MKKKILISLIIFFNIFLQIFPVFAVDLESLPVWSNTSNLTVQVSGEPTFDIASEARNINRSHNSVKFYMIKILMNN